MQLTPSYDDPETSRFPHDVKNFDKKLYLYNTARTCEFELTQTLWYDYRYDPEQGSWFFSNHFSPLLKFIKCEFSGSDVAVCKNTY
mgnify:CR=1 FL=1